MDENACKPIRLLQEQDREVIRNTPSAESTVSRVLELPEGEPDNPVAAEWNLYRQEVGRLLDEGCRGKFALVKRGQQLTVWDNLHDAVQAGEMLYGPRGHWYNRFCPT